MIENVPSSLWKGHSEGVFVTSCRGSGPVEERKEDHPAVQVHVRDNNVDQALRALKKKMQREGIFREMKLRRHFEKPSQRRKRERAEAKRRYRKLLRKRMDREGY